MVKIRLKRFGAKKNPHYRIVVTDSRRARDGAYIESLGNYNPRGAKGFTLDESRLQYWVANGAQVSPRVKSLRKRLTQGEKPEVKEAKSPDEKEKPEPAIKQQAQDTAEEKKEPLNAEETEQVAETKTEAKSTEGGSDEGPS
ncbi:30S ribosomal protein S16 [candidate division WOR-3 bacterium]|uniref:Small ribosomal subunit protein bS16 n=1 Tax=candidate division WOR-3 bacterium TaxID=2052148 RepID=A0A9D5K7J0_UNCW3|nr:30S ribosomal protein S16 [candidate division WOR-3 bacterium]MBD3363766.1 30S ribosomal protein S16 [candidate division WOR-3 bacterium]